VSTTATGSLAGPFQRAFVRTLILSMSNEGYMSLCRVIATAEKPNYAEIQVPLLIIAGDDDKTAPLAASEAILEAYATRKSEKKIEVLNGVGHWHCIEAPADVERLVKKFVLDVA
jgi:pimeloyl-ACP methyl ester carboxylesterase